MAEISGGVSGEVSGEVSGGVSGVVSGGVSGEVCCSRTLRARVAKTSEGSMTTAKPTCPFCLMEMKRSHDVVGESPNFWCVCPAFGKNVVSQEDLEEFCAAVMEMRRKDFHAGMTAESEGFVSEYELDAAWDDYINAEARRGEEEK